ncbi:hypothetical protein D3C71_1428720 [compost metagenome]
MIGQSSGLMESFNPKLPIVTTHHSNGIIDFFVCSRLNRNLTNFTRMKVYGFISVGISYRFNYGVINFTRHRICSTG